MKMKMSPFSSPLSFFRLLFFINAFISYVIVAGSLRHFCLKVIEIKHVYAERGTERGPERRTPSVGNAERPQIYSLNGIQTFINIKIGDTEREDSK